MPTLCLHLPTFIPHFHLSGFFLAGTLRHSSIYFLFSSRAAEPQGRFLLYDNALSGIQANPMWRTLCRPLVGKCLKYLYYLSLKRMEGKKKKKKAPFSFKGSQMKHSSTFSPVSWISGHPELMHLLPAGTEEKVIAKISIATF